jgi:signal transduction histidine kinase
MSADSQGRQLKLAAIAASLALLGALVTHILTAIVMWRTLPVSPTTLVSPSAGLRFVVLSLVGLCYLGIGAWFLLRQWGDGRAQMLAVFCASVAISLATSFGTETSQVMARVWAVATPAVPATLVLLGLDYLPQKAAWYRTTWGRILCLAPMVAVAVSAQIACSMRNPMLCSASRTASLALVGAGILSFVGMLAYARAKPSYARTRQQAQTALLGSGIALAPTLIWAAASAFGGLLPSLGQVALLEPLVTLPASLALPFAVGYTIKRYRLSTLDPLRSPPYHDRISYATTIQGFARELTASIDAAYIIQKLLSYVCTMFHPRHAVVHMVSQTDAYELYQGWGQIDLDMAQRIRFTVHDRLIARLQRDGEGLLLTPRALEGLRLSQDERSRLDKLDVALVIPLRSQDHLLGVLALAGLGSGDTYATDDITLLDTMAALAAVAAENALLYEQQVDQEYRLVQQTRRLTDILALGNQLKSLDRSVVVQSTVDAIHERLGFDLVTLSLVEEDDPTRVRVVAWAGIESDTWERLTSTSFPLIDFETLEGVQKLEHCYLICAAGTSPEISTSQTQVPWHEGDQLFVPLIADEELLGYLTVDRPQNGLRPTDDKLEVLEIFANQATIAIQNANLYSSIDQALDERVAELATLQEIDTQLNVKLDFDYVMNMTLEWAMRITSAVAGTLALVAPDGKTQNVVAHKGYPPEMDQYWSTPWPIEEGIVGRVIQTGEPQMVDDVARYADYVDTGVRTRSHLAAPIKREGQVIGTITLESPEPNGFTVENMSFLVRLADHAAIAIENVMLYEQTNRRVAELTALQQISLDLTSSLNLSAVLESVAANTFALTQADEITIYLYDEHEDTLFFGTGLSKEGKQERPPIPIPDDELTAVVARRREAIVFSDTSEHPSLRPEWQIGAMASIPLQKAGQVLGVFDIFFREAHFFAPDERRALNLLADQAAIAIQNAQLFLEVQRANEAKNEFVGIVSHELKVPMTSIQGYARLMTLGAAGPVSQQQQGFASIILKNVERMGNLVSDLLDLARIESGRIQLSPRPVDVTKLIQDAVRVLQDEIDAHEHTLEISVPDDLPNVKADPARIIQVWTNLISNAYKYTPRGGTIKAWARPHGSRDTEGTDGRWILCAVQDNGVGIDVTDQERIFEQFYRVQHVQTNEEQGTGLGLSITRSIVELHGGHIWVESEPGQGSTFYFTLPAA